VIDTSILSDHAQRESGWPGEYGTENCSENHQDHRQIRSQTCGKSRMGAPPLRTTSWESYKMNLEAILKSAPIRFHSKENLKLAAQYVSDAIKEAYES